VQSGARAFAGSSALSTSRPTGDALAALRVETALIARLLTVQ
jgi:hypothetical protein